MGSPASQLLNLVQPREEGRVGLVAVLVGRGGGLGWWKDGEALRGGRVRGDVEGGAWLEGLVGGHCAPACDPSATR